MLIVGFVIGLYLFVEQHVGVARLGVPAAEAFALDFLSQIYFSDYSVVEFEPLLFALDIRVVMTSFCGSWVDQYTTESIHMGLAFFLFLVYINFILDFDIFLYLLISQELL